MNVLAGKDKALANGGSANNREKQYPKYNLAGAD